jgi:DNA-binding NarL/FixJ family response regulator
MARVLALVPDLLFGSRLAAACMDAGLELELLGDERRLRERLASEDEEAPDVLVFDLTDPALDGAALLEELRAHSALGKTRTLGFYAHVDTVVRERAQAAGFDLVVPRSRMAREGAQLLARLSDARAGDSSR